MCVRKVEKRERERERKSTGYVYIYIHISFERAGLAAIRMHSIVISLILLDSIRSSWRG